MLTVWLLLFGTLLLTLVLGDRLVRRLPLSPAVVYLAVGWLAGAALGAPPLARIEAWAPALVVVTESAVLVSLFAVGLRLRVPPSWASWRVALLLAGPGMVVTTALGAVAAALLLGQAWPAALLLAALLAPTDPVLASEVQIRSEVDRDAVRLSLTAEGGLNDGAALPAVMLGLGLLGLHELGPGGGLWVWRDLLWPVGGGALIGALLGVLLGRALRWRLEQGDRIARDELFYVAAVLLAFGVARATGTSTFLVVFATGALLLWPLQPHDALAEGGQLLAERLFAFGARIERLVEAASVLVVGVALHSVPITPAMLGFGTVLVLVVRPLAVLSVVRRGQLARQQRRLVAWFGIRGIGSLYYLAYALEHGVGDTLADLLVGATLTAIALSILLHGVSATPLMSAYQRRRQPAAGRPPAPSATPPGPP